MESTGARDDRHDDGQFSSNQNLPVQLVGANVLRQEAEALLIMADELQSAGAPMNRAFQQAVQKMISLSETGGRVIVCGMGKSGHIGHKIAATLASTGVPSFFVHPSEASHGDLGMITKRDVVIVISNSGKSAELAPVINYVSRWGIPLIAITSNPKSPLGKEADIKLLLPKIDEACPIGKAPMTSTTMTLALGDALAAAAMHVKGFTAEDFGKYHPGGSLGSALKRVRDIMYPVEELPLLPKTATSQLVLSKMTAGQFGCVGVVDKDERIVGIITNNDVVSRMRDGKLPSQRAAKLMTPNPATVRRETLASEALHIANERVVAQLVVTDDEKRPVGVVRLHDLLTSGLA